MSFKGWSCCKKSQFALFRTMVMFRHHTLRYWKLRRCTPLFLAHKSHPLNGLDRRQKVLLGTKKVHFTETKDCANA